MAGGGKSSSNPITGFKYFFALQMTPSRGPLDALLEIVVGEKTAWKGEQAGNGRIQIDKPNLFGGDEKEGGVVGPLDVFMGASDQVVSQELKDILDGDVPDFRGTANFYFNGTICSNNPYPKAWKFRVRRAIEGWSDNNPWYPDRAIIPIPDTEDPSQIIKTMNGAHILYECSTNPAWGRGLPRTMMDDDAFTLAADILASENLGLCLRWVRSDRLSEFVGSVVNHIGATMYVSRQTGLVTLKLLRFDYDPDELPIFGYDTGLLDISADETGAASEMANEIIVKYRRVAKDEERMVRVHNLASFQANGAVISNTLEFPGFPTFDLATRVAQRELRVRTADLKRFKLRLDRRAYQLEPGSPFRISVPSRGIANMILRVGRIEQLDPKSNDFTVTAAEDVFGMASTAIVHPQAPLWKPPDSTPRQSLNVLFEEPSYRDLFLQLTPTELAAVAEDATGVTTVARRPSDLSQDYELWTKTVAEDLYNLRDTGSFAPFGSLGAAINEYDTNISFDIVEDLNLPAIPGPARIGAEVVRVDSIDVDAKTAVIARGCLDTVPRRHSPGAIMLFTDSYTALDNREYTVGDEVHGRLLTRTLAGVLPFELAADYVRVLENRHFRPYPPADVQVNAVPYGLVSNVFGVDVELTWITRNRVMQMDTLVSHTEAPFAPEAGTTYNVRVKSGDVILRETTAIAVETYTYTQADWLADGSVSDVTFELESERDGAVSWTMYSFHLRFDSPDAGTIGVSQTTAGSSALRRIFGGRR